MSRFTFFTILFSLIVIVIVGQLVLRDALFPQEYQTDVVSTTVGSGDGSDIIVDEGETKEIVPYISDESLPEEFIIDEPPEPIPISTPTSVVKAQNILDMRLLQQVGFAEVGQKIFLGKIFDLFDISRQSFSSVVSYEMKEKAGVIGVATEIEMKDEISAQELYKLIQNKSKVYIDLLVNETNQFGDRSFYINHRKKVDEAFLAVRMKNRIYAFAYLKDYHPRIKTLINLLYAAILDRQ